MIGTRPPVFSGQVDVFPSQRRDVRKEFDRDLKAGFVPGQDGLAQFQRVPVDDDRGQQVEASDSVMLTLFGSVAQFAARVEVDGALQSMMGLTLVQSALRAPAHVGVRGPVDHEQRALANGLGGAHEVGVGALDTALGVGGSVCESGDQTWINPCHRYLESETDP